MSTSRLTVPALLVGVFFLGGCEQRGADEAKTAVASAPPQETAPAALEARSPTATPRAKEGGAQNANAEPVSTKPKAGTNAKRKAAGSAKRPAPEATQQASAPPAPKPPASTTVGSEMAFDSLQHNFGEMWNFQSRTHRFEFKNSGTETLIVEDIKTSCGCTAAELEKKEFAPGEGSAIEVTFSPKNRTGPQTKLVTVVTNAKDADPIRLRISAQVKSLVTAEPARLDPVGVLGTPHRSVITLVSPDPDLEVTNVASNGEHIKARSLGRSSGPQRAEGDESPPPIRIEVEIPATATWGESSGTVSIKTLGQAEGLEAPVENSVRVPVRATMFGQLRAEPVNFRLGVLKPGAKLRKAIRLIRDSAEPFKILSAKVERSKLPGMEVRFQPIEEEGVVGYRVILVGGDAPNERQSLAATVVIETDVPGEEELEIRVSGYVRP